jgi:hypothetical protein
MGSALLDTDLLDPAFAVASSDSPSAAAHAPARTDASPASTEALRRQVADRLAAHRLRRAPAQPALAFSATPSSSAPSRASRIAAAVAQRYAHSPSYRAVLAAEAERATQQAQAAAQIAALNAQAVAAAQQQLLDSLNHDSLNDEAPDQTPPTRSVTNAGAPSSATASSSPKVGSAESRSHHTPANAQPFAPALSGLTVRIFEDAATPLRDAAHLPLAASSASHRNRQQEDRNEAEARRLDEEIAFRHSPVFEEPAGPPMPLPANLIEFPRQLVARAQGPPRATPKARCAPPPVPPQERVSSASSRSIPPRSPPLPPPPKPPPPSGTRSGSTHPTPVPPNPPPRLLCCPPVAKITFHPVAKRRDLLFPSARPAQLPQIASIARRLTAAAIDASILLAGFMAFAAAFLLAAFRSIPWQAAASLPAASLPLDRHPSPGSLGRPVRRPHRTPAQPRSGRQRPRPRPPHSPLPGALLLLLRVHPWNALHPHRPLHLRRREPHPPRDASPHPRRPPLRLPPRPRPALGRLRRRPPRMA